MQLKWSMAIFFSILFILALPDRVHAQAISSPQGPHVWCLSGQAAVRLNWFPVSGATSYQVRLDSDVPSWDGTCQSPDSCATTTTNEITLPIVPGENYDWWVHSVNANGWSQPAMAGVEFSCNIPVPNGLYYQCRPNNIVEFNWYDTNVSHLYELSVDANPSSWNGTCAAPDKCVSVTENKATVSLAGDNEYEFWVQAKDTKGNKSPRSQIMEIRCNNTTPTMTPIPSAVPTLLPSVTSTPTLSPTPSEPPETITPTQEATPTPTLTPEPTINTNNCARRPEGDANCDGTITIQDSFCWEKAFTINFLSVGTGCKYTNFDEEDGTNILDYAIWYVHWEL